jgi:uncharacterized membrane protein YeaQ/YmgE (transglycosylase-associated protein family)
MDFTKLGIEVADLIAGLCGGMVNALVFQKSSPWGALASVVVGALTAAYLAASMATQFNVRQGPAGFIVGLTAMAICQGLMNAAQKWAAARRTDDGTPKGP